MPKHDKTAEQIEAENERFLLEQAKAFIRDLRATAQNAPYGKIIHLADAFALKAGREFTRQALETLVQEQNDLLEKKRHKKVPLRRRSKTPRQSRTKNVEHLRRA